MENDTSESWEFGVSFSLHRASELNLDKKRLLEAALYELGFRRFRLMSYWNIHEQIQGSYDFTELDWQLDMIAEAGGKVSLCLGKRQPRWPECHMPEWAKKLPKEGWYEALFAYVKTVVLRYKNHPALDSWQLENEALLKSFGHCEDNDYSHERLRTEFQIVKKADPNHQIIMTLSDSWGIPFKRPKPDKYAMSLYRITLKNNGMYSSSKRPALFYRLRAWLIMHFKRRGTFIHELQAEPWLKNSLPTHSVQEQLQRFNTTNLKNNVVFAQRTGMRPIDLWGLEWWYWLKTVHQQDEIWLAVRQLLSEQNT